MNLNPKFVYVDSKKSYGNNLQHQEPSIPRPSSQTPKIKQTEVIDFNEPTSNSHYAIRAIQEDGFEPKKNTPSKVKKDSAVQMLNDLTHLKSLKNSNYARPNVLFEAFDKEVLELHSLVLFARSNWFRRSWRMNNSSRNPELNEDLQDGYNFKKEKFSKELGFRIKISCIEKIPESPDGEFKFNLELEVMDKSQNKEEVRQQFLKAFKEFRKFMYRGECEVVKYSDYLIALSSLFEVGTLNDFISEDLVRNLNLNSNNVDFLIHRLLLAHIYGLDLLKSRCIEEINKIPIRVINSAKWEEVVVEKYPGLILEVFQQKGQVNN